MSIEEGLQNSLVGLQITAKYEYTMHLYNEGIPLKTIITNCYYRFVPYWTRTDSSGTKNVRYKYIIQLHTQ